MIWFLLVFAVLARFVTEIIYVRVRRAELRERMALIRFEMGQLVRELQEANAEAEKTICSGCR